MISNASYKNKLFEKTTTVSSAIWSPAPPSWGGGEWLQKKKTGYGCAAHFPKPLPYLWPIYELTKHLIPYLWPDTRLATKMAKIDTLFMTKTAKKPYPLGCTYLHSPFKGVPPPVTRANHSLASTKNAEGAKYNLMNLYKVLIFNYQPITFEQNSWKSVNCRLSNQSQSPFLCLSPRKEFSSSGVPSAYLQSCVGGNY